MSVFLDTPHLVLFAAMTGMAVMSGLAIIRSVYLGRVASAWIWAALFGASSLVAAWSFWRLT